MKKIALNLFALTITAALLVSCSSESVNDEMTSLNSTTNVFEKQDIRQNDLVGTWKIKAMNSDVAVDLDADGTSNTNILEETTCFDNLFFNFNAEGGVLAHQARLNFVDGEMQCDGEGDYAATYEVAGNELSVSFQSGETTLTFTKTIGLSTVDGAMYLHVAIEDYEVEELVKDPGNTSVSSINRIEMIYKKQ
ncbi:lipocalin family protein [Salinimicrobium gaetbulicola]|uniref:Lipocalin family protein n=1 Tax=Salinimicrobium gaetbulicola TaxID=999702 RepID=A0ABW3II71_9FLAO